MIRLSARGGGAVFPHTFLENLVELSKAIGQFRALFNELQRDRVDAVPAAGGRRTVFKDVTQVAIAPRATNFNSPHSVRIVRQFLNVFGRNGDGKTRPPGTTI